MARQNVGPTPAPKALTVTATVASPLVFKFFRRRTRGPPPDTGPAIAIVNDSSKPRFKLDHASDFPLQRARRISETTRVAGLRLPRGPSQSEPELAIGPPGPATMFTVTAPGGQAPPPTGI